MGYNIVVYIVRFDGVRDQKTLFSRLKSDYRCYRWRCGRNDTLAIIISLYDGVTGPHVNRLL